MADINPFLGITVALLSGGGIGAIAAFRKAGPEVEAISVTTLRGVIEELRAELERKDKQIREMNVTIGGLKANAEEARRQATEARREARSLAARVEVLERNHAPA